MSRTIRLTVNGVTHSLEVEPWETLIEILRRRLDLTGAKLGCDQQVCGACTVLMNGLPVSSCSVLGVDAAETELLTIEGLARNGELHPIQKAFIEHGAFQCAYCTSGLILAVKALLDQMASSYEGADEEQIRHFLSGNLCRCGCHVEILGAVRSLLRQSQQPKEAQKA
jgi:aerobic-type carbon monoxide dehydrogenase small subunit (CoxS/CutS family)